MKNSRQRSLRPSPVAAFKASSHYVKMLGSLNGRVKILFDRRGRDVSKAIFFHLVKMKHADWKLRVQLQRGKRHTFAEMFQDILAFYLEACLPSEYEISVEEKCGDIRPDIIVRRNGTPIFAIEAKTSIGWDRQGPDGTFHERINKLSRRLKIPRKNVLFVLEQHENAKSTFSSRYWDKKMNKARKPPTSYPYSQIKPLFCRPDPYYWKYERGFDKDRQIEPFSRQSVLAMAEAEIVVPFEHVVEAIRNARLK